MTAWESPDRRQAWALYRHRRIFVRWPRWHRAVIARRLPDLRSMTCGFFPLHFGRWPPDRRSMIGRCPTGRRRMRKSGEESADHPANFNCELNLSDHRRMSPGWVQNRRMAAGFFAGFEPRITTRWSGDRFCPIVTKPLVLQDSSNFANCLIDFILSVSAVY